MDHRSIISLLPFQSFIYLKRNQQSALIGWPESTIEPLPLPPPSSQFKWAGNAAHLHWRCQSKKRDRKKWKQTDKKTEIGRNKKSSPSQTKIEMMYEGSPKRRLMNGGLEEELVEEVGEAASNYRSSKCHLSQGRSNGDGGASVTLTISTDYHQWPNTPLFCFPPPPPPPPPSPPATPPPPPPPLSPSVPLIALFWGGGGWRIWMDFWFGCFDVNWWISLLLLLLLLLFLLLRPITRRFHWISEFYCGQLNPH